jgi:hypothetical protein
MKLRATLIGCLGTALLASAAFASTGCQYEGNAYSDGAKVCQTGTQYRCDGGEWKSLLVQCKADSSPPNCEYNGNNYSAGATSCQSGMQFRCTDGAWTNLSVACSPSAPVADAPRGAPHTCMLEGATVASASTVCKEGTTYLCNDGDWRNLGTPCR